MILTWFQDRYIHLRKYLEHCPIEENGNAPLNPDGLRQYYIITTHCHYDHIGGISQFLSGGTTEIIASAAGRDFIESDLEAHGLFKYIDVSHIMGKSAAEDGDVHDSWRGLLCAQNSSTNSDSPSDLFAFD